MKKEVQIGWDDSLQVYRQVNKGETTVGVTIVKTKPNLSELYKEKNKWKQQVGIIRKSQNTEEGLFTSQQINEGLNISVI